MDSLIRVLLFVRRVGPYHHARFQSVKECRLMVVETRPDSQEYAWKFEAKGKYELKQFPRAADPERGIRGRELKDAVKNIFIEYEPNVIVTTGWADPEYHAAVFEAMKRKIPRVVISDSRHEDEPRKYYKEWLKRIILKSYSSAIAAGSASRSYLLRLGFEPDSIYTPWDVIDNNHFSRDKPVKLAFAERDFVCVSRFIAKKNLVRLLHSFSQYRKTGGKRNLKLLGSGTLEMPLRKKVDDLRLNSNVSFEGFKQYEELPSYLNQGLCLILPSISDQWGLVVNEAMASGLPVLVSDQCGCVSDLVESGKNGFIFNPFDEEDITRAMFKMDQLKVEEWQSMSQAAQRKIENWDLPHFAKALYDSSADALASKSSNGLSLLHFLLGQ